jgi:hypothetical protein
MEERGRWVWAFDALATIGAAAATVAWQRRAGNGHAPIGRQTRPGTSAAT